MKKLTVICIAILVLLTGCTYMNVPEPEQCSLCSGLPCHAPCIINLSTGEKLELNVYEPHPFTAGELAEEQRGGYFSFIRGAGIEGFKLGSESITVTVPMKTECLDQRFFCVSCRERLRTYESQEYVLVDIIDPKSPIIYGFFADSSFSFRCYEISISASDEGGVYKMCIEGTLHTAN